MESKPPSEESIHETDRRLRKEESDRILRRKTLKNEAIAFKTLDELLDRIEQLIPGITQIDSNEAVNTFLNVARTRLQQIPPGAEQNRLRTRLNDAQKVIFNVARTHLDQK